jgi:hypothetical protein
MALNQETITRNAPSVLLFQKLLQLIGERRYYAEIENIDKTLKRDIQQNRPTLNWIGIKAVVKLVLTIARISIRNIFWVEQWYLLLSTVNGSSESSANNLHIVPTLDRFWADPHIINKNGITYIFVEEYFYNKKKACISVIECDEAGVYKRSTPIIERDYHLSYPSIFEFEGRYFLVPETSENRTIEIYECSQFPYRWQFVMNLMENTIAVDSTLLYYSNQWWLFTAIPAKSEALPKVQLHLFHSENLLSNQWTPHSQNPIVSDSTTARPAGNIFSIDGKLYRPSQDTSKSYGAGILINEITILTESDYEEKCVRTIYPNWDKQIKGTHTYSRKDSLIAMDVYRRISRFLIRK